MTSSWVRQLAAVVSVGLLIMVAGCNSSAGEGAGAETTPSAAGDAFPVTIEHGFGSTTIEEAPQRVVAIGFNEQDFVVALGVEPVGVREFLGYDAPNRPWAPDSIWGKEISTVGAQELDLEEVAALDPDLILGINSFIDEKQYELLAKIAPTVAQSDDYAPGATPWDQQTLTTGTALGKTAEAEQLVSETRAVFEQAVADHPEFAGKQASFLLGSSADGVYNLGADDYRTGWLIELGFEVDDKGGQVGLEQLGTLDRDVMIGEGVQDEQLESDVFQNLSVIKEDRYVGLGQFDDDFAAALGFNSPLSLPFLLDIAVPRLSAAADDDPATSPEPYPGE